MYSPVQFTALALIFAQLLGAIHCGVYDNTDNWVLSSKSKSFPENAVLGGFDPEGYRSFVGRVLYAGSVVPARIRAETAYVTFNTDSVANTATSYEVLVSNETLSYQWVRSFDGFMEDNAVSVGTSSTNERVYICRARTYDAVFIGTLYLAQRKCNIRYESIPPKMYEKYEVLVRKQKPADCVHFDNQIN
ncbi:uncharacterized protein LOC6562448 isoform X1 [Drosophila grimshawi]|uniref:GH10741 n=1 Tax=Drosophila grimshawi TaxID=7222 RepID=B4JBQ1_DROGR|nr:uncharacterized protein LOC6562448 isoform X1 [Drosophila grimshawi]EDW02986.1 GH10741 [Drosophila grimshawi]